MALHSLIASTRNASTVNLFSFLAYLSPRKVNATTVGNGRAGNILINTTNLIEISNKGFQPEEQDLNNTSQILASADRVNAFLAQGLGLINVPQGNSGNLAIITKNLRIINGGQISVRNEGTGNAGDLQINASSVVLDKGAGITASTQSGEGGNITITSQDIRLFDSQISATAGGTGNGGNINVDTGTLALLNNSSITANAFEGQGGNVNIAGQGFLASLDSSITASSQFGTEGVVQLNINPLQIVATDTGLPVRATSLEDLLTQTCSILSKRRDRFTVRGTGGAGTGQVRGYTLEDLAPSGQVFGFIKRSNGTVRLLSCDSLDGIDSEMSSNQE